MTRNKMKQNLTNLSIQANRAYMSGSRPMMELQMRYLYELASQCDELHFRAIAKEARSMVSDLLRCFGEPAYRGRSGC
jgi:hypothetical protein